MKFTKIITLNMFYKNYINNINPTFEDNLKLQKYYNVLRSNGTIEKNWKLRAGQLVSHYKVCETVSKDDFIILYKPLITGGEMTKAIPYKSFLSLNPEFEKI